MKIAQHTFLITGGASGLGAACGRLLNEAGANVVLADLNEAAARQLSEPWDDAGLAVKMDVTSEESVRAGLAETVMRFGELHGVVNCAGILGAGRILSKDGPHDLALFRKVIEVNLIGTFNVMRLAAQTMSGLKAEHYGAEDDGERGVIINTSSVAALEGQIGQCAYGASKGGVAALTLPAARELARFGIRVVAIAPGVFETPMMEAAPDAVRQSLVSQTVFPQRLGTAGEFALLVKQIIENQMLNGSLIRLDGAMRMGAK